MKGIVLIFLLATLMVQRQGFANSNIAPQIDISGTGFGTFGYSKNNEFTAGRAALNFSDSALQLSVAEHLFENGTIGSFDFGLLTTEASNSGQANPLFLHRAFVKYQADKLELTIGRSDSASAHIISFPTLREDDLVTLTNSLNPLSSGKNTEEHRYANLAAATFNQHLSYYENIHVQHLINSSVTNADNRINSFGASFHYLGAPGLENFELLPTWGISYERISVNSSSAKWINQASIGALINLNESIVNHFELGIQNLQSWGSNLNSFFGETASFEANSNSSAASIRFLHQESGRAAYDLSLSLGFKEYPNVVAASSFGFALTGVKHLGNGFDFVAQYQGQSRSAILATAQTQNLQFEQTGEIGLAFNFGASINEHISPQRTLLNQEHHFLSE